MYLVREFPMVGRDDSQKTLLLVRLIFDSNWFELEADLLADLISVAKACKHLVTSRPPDRSSEARDHANS